MAAYANNCSSCHRDDLSGYNGALNGDRFMEEWREDRLYSLFNTIRITMPRGAPASLSDETYVDIVSYVLQVNGFPEGVEELNVERLRQIQLVGRDGPKPPPDFALVQVVGCLTRDATGIWTLTSSTDPFRTREPGASSDPDLESAKSTLPGTHVFALTDIEFVRPTLHPPQYAGQRLQAKGFLNRRPSQDRISLTALQPLGSSCSQ